MPEIRANGDCVTFDLDMTRVHAGARLLIRCDREGAVWVCVSNSQFSR